MIVEKDIDEHVNGYDHQSNEFIRRNCEPEIKVKQLDHAKYRKT